MKSLSAALILALFVVACERFEPSIAVQQVEFGEGGGIIWAYSKYTLDANGHLSGGMYYPGIPELADTVFNYVTKTIDPLTARWYMDRAGGLFTYTFNKPMAEVSRELRIVAPGGDHYIQWSGPEVDPRVTSLYEDLNKLLK